MMRARQPKTRKSAYHITQPGFTLTEMIISVAVAGIIAGVATPAYINQSKSNCQRVAESQLNQILASVQAFNDEFRDNPNGWNDLDKITTLTTTSGPALQESFSPITLASCNYQYSGTKDASNYIFIASPAPTSSLPTNSQFQSSGFNVAACINTDTGAGDTRKGDGETGATKEDLNC